MWEFDVIQFTPMMGIRDKKYMLNSVGKEGWEVVGTTISSNDYTTIYLMRKLPSAKKGSKDQ